MGLKEEKSIWFYRIYGLNLLSNNSLQAKFPLRGIDAIDSVAVSHLCVNLTNVLTVT